MVTCFLWGVLQNIWSMRLHECLANLVGKLILGKKLFVHIKSKKSPNFSRSEICNRFILKSPTIAAYVFSLWRIAIMGESSDINCCIFTLLLLSWGGRYTFPIVNVRQRLPPVECQTITWTVQCWLINNWSLGIQLQSNLIPNIKLFIQQRTLEYVVCKMSTSCSRPQCVNHHIALRGVWTATHKTNKYTMAHYWGIGGLNPGYQPSSLMLIW